jgi:cytochrome c-type biogenesis protein CcmE
MERDMKFIQKLILPLLIGLVIFVIYTFYFAGKSDLGSFSDFDPNNNAVKDIRVKLLVDKGINMQGSDVVFYVVDKTGKVVMVSGTLDLPENFDRADVIILKGHLTQNGFHAHGVEVD